MITSKFRFVAIVCILLLLGFSATSVTSYLVAKNVLQESIRSDILPLTSDNIYSEIQRDILPTVVISSLMAQDTFVRDWIINGEKDSTKIVNYLKSIQDRYKTDTAFFISEATHDYYHSSGILRKVKQSEPADSWYFKIEGLKDDYEINVDRDTATPDQTTVFVNHKIIDYQGQYLGTIGVGLSTDTVIKLIENYQSRYDRQVYFIDPNGNVALHGKRYHGEGDMFTTDDFSKIFKEVLSNAKSSHIYHRDGANVFMNARYVDELNWYLIVEQIDKSNFQMKGAFLINIVLGLVIGIIILVLAYLTVGGYQRRLETMAAMDKLTDVHNRHSFDPLSQQVMKVADRRRESLSAVIIDIDDFKDVNDQYGHLIGDHVIAKLARILKENSRDSDLICRWGGEEFIVLLPGSNLEKASLWAEKIRQIIENDKIIYEDKEISVTASFGVSCYVSGESQDTFFNRADTGLYQAKNNGRNRVEVA